MKPVASLLVLLLILAVAPAGAADGGACPPCGEWQLDVAASDSADAAIDAAMARYKPPRPKRYRPHYGDIASETEAEFQASLDERQGPRERERLRKELAALVASPERFTLTQDGGDVVIEPAGGYRRRVSPGQPHARVDELGTARIEARWRGNTLTISEEYRRRTENREVYALDARKGLLKVTRSVRRPGLPAVVVHSTYRRP